ncbi:3-oxoacyl-ACP synthase [Streptomyces sp. NBC_00091]|uniref:3-oxoacyl-ACP synthase n=1 Tax=Streptomyces sp. NBC_00091 TaxID=2975648 RepID=UPI0022592226|nr:3-oxoacyl-ACP synthase [Streptomyces sp. NBC_00091]MCX5381597.1 3-oxoacyl-ACP synthase [Streptomyces sp. NBC_00091]
MRLPAPLAVRSAAVHLPGGRQTVADAVAAGRLTAADASRSGYRALPVAAPGETPESLAVRAAEQALRTARTDPARLGLLVHTWLHRPAHAFWSPAHHIAARLGAEAAVPLAVHQMSNGAAAALHTAAAWLTADPGAGPALITAADTFPSPGFDRWRGDVLLYGDAGCAAVLDAAPDDRTALRLVSLASAAVPALEAVHRAGRPAGSQAPPTPRDTRRTFIADRGAEAFTAAVRDGAARAVTAALAHARLRGDDPSLRLVLLPRVGAHTLKTLYAPVLDTLLPGVPLADHGAHTGHLGAGDLLANLAALTAPDARLGPGDHALILNGGGGFTWTCAVLHRP